VKFEKDKFKSHSWEGRDPGINTGWDCLAGGSSVEKVLGVGGPQAEHEPTVTLAAMKTKSFLGCVNRDRDHRT